MDTSPESRLAKLLASQNISKPRAPVPGEKTFAEKELESQIARQAAWHQPKAQQEQPESLESATEPIAIMQPLTDSESDEYVAAFTKKPSMKPPKAAHKKRRPGASSTRKTTSGNSEDLTTDLELREELKTIDENGNHATGHFCVLSLAARFPYKYMDDGNDRVSRHFFAGGKFYDRTWDVYYVHPPESAGLQPLLLLPYEQVVVLINEIAATFQADVAVPAYPFTLTFFADGTPQPVQLGTSTSREQMGDLEERIPQIPSGHGEVPKDASTTIQAALAAFRTKFERVATVNKKKNSGSKSKKKAAQQSAKMRSWCHSLNRSQRYFGLLPPHQKVLTPSTDMPWDEQVKFMQEQDRKVGIKVGPLDVQTTAPFEYDKSPVFVCIDIESYERGHHLITEVGISTLDMLDLVGLPPGEHGANWRKHIRSRHFRISEHVHLRNTDFCIGDPDAFQFGKSEFVSLADVGEEIDSCFEWPFSAQYKHDGKFNYETWQDLTQSAAFTSAADSSTGVSTSKSIEGLQKGPKERNILLVGHDLNADLAYLAKLGSSIFSPEASAVSYPPVEGLDKGAIDPKVLRGAKGLHSIKEALDTAILYKVLKGEQQTKSLTSLLYDLEIRAFFLHNGGNDARYTLEALVSLAIKARLARDEANRVQDAEAARLANAWNDDTAAEIKTAEPDKW